MPEISNSTLALLVFSALVVVVAGTVYTFNTESSFGPTGRAISDQGNVSLTIATALNIQVDPNNGTIAFGRCTPRAVSYWCASDDALECNNVNNSQGNCTLDNGSAQYIRVLNVGNVNASVNVTSSCSAATLIGGTSPALTYLTTYCNGTNVTTWTTLDSTTRLACPQIVPTTGTFRMFVNVTIPSDATGANSGCTGVSTLTFSAI